MQNIQGVLLEPVGCLAEFGSKEFNEIAANFYGQKKKFGSAYWQLLRLMQDATGVVDQKAVEALEIQAVDNASVYEDVVPALEELQSMGVKLLITTSLSEPAVNHFLEKFSLGKYFDGVWNRTNAGGVLTQPLNRALASAGLDPEQVMSLADTEEGLNLAKEVGVNSILMINDYDDGRRLAMHPPTGGIVSLAELPDAIRLIAENAKAPRSS
jgi:phosphoglycolate phosphatase-like HAD superfamily hydrolase